MGLFIGLSSHAFYNTISGAKLVALFSQPFHFCLREQDLIEELPNVNHGIAFFLRPLYFSFQT